MHFRHISAKIQPENLKQFFHWGWVGPLGYALALQYVSPLGSSVETYSNSNSIWIRSHWWT